RRAVKLGATGFIIPFLFVYEPAILLQGEPLKIAIALTQAVFGVLMLAASLHGYLRAPLKKWQQLVLFLGAIGLIYPDWIASIPAACCVLLVLLTSKAETARESRVEAQS
ncbi:MAG: hypothetical protein MI861_10340, partial [Pirellulales bacterium]|nr:hypothetical protein [Pirellulales bacterium]